jgi:hypothetical protein
MANSQTAFLARAQVPTRQALQEAIKSLRFKLTIDDAYAPFACAGYIPCTLADVPQLQAKLGDRDAAMTIRWGGDARERVSALMVSAALAQSFGALVQRQGEDGFRAADQLLDEARGAFAQLQEQ